MAKEPDNIELKEIPTSIDPALFEHLAREQNLLNLIKVKDYAHKEMVTCLIATYPSIISALDIKDDSAEIFRDSYLDDSGAGIVAALTEDSSAPSGDAEAPMGEAAPFDSGE